MGIADNGEGGVLRFGWERLIAEVTECFVIHRQSVYDSGEERNSSGFQASKHCRRPITSDYKRTRAAVNNRGE
jgi:hypothetical protein